MSIKRIADTTIDRNKILEYSSKWQRPTDWEPMPTILPTDNKIAILTAVWDTDSEFVSVKAVCTAGTYNVDWGDGTTTIGVSNSIQANHQYNYATLSTQVCSRGYKTAVITITHNSGGGLVAYQHSLHPSKYSLSTLSWLDMIISCPSGTSGNQCTMNNSGIACFPALLERFVILSGYIAASSFFSGCKNLQYISSLNITGSTYASNMFLNCRSLKYIPEITGLSGLTAAIPTITVTGMFSSCYSLEYLYKFPIPSGVTTSQMFYNCYSLKEIPSFHFVSTNASNMFSACTALTTINATFDLSNCTTTNFMFTSCSNLQEIPSSISTTTTALTDTASMFSNCTVLKSVPYFNTSNVTTMASMINNCHSLTTIPLYDTANVTGSTGFSTFASNCDGITEIPLFVLKTTGLTSFTPFGTMSELRIIPEIAIPDTVTTFTPFTVGGNITKMRMTNLPSTFTIGTHCLSKSELEIIFGNLKSGTTVKTVTITGNYGSPTPITKPGCGVTLGSYTITQTNTSGIEIGQQVTAVGTSTTTPAAVTLTDATDLVTRTAHGLQNDDEISFAAITTTTGLVINTIYYVINATTDTFQVAATLGGAALPLTTNGSGTIRYRLYVTAINTNVSIIVSRPLTATNASANVSFQLLNTSTALLKGWGVTQ